ncbi:CSTF1 [Lepeophtheirus salmonis]|uniref:Cleavage stimulation factor subunit 1 n=1 Tax=Lepeophtheirus salmonis TaxID=72036 RepID=C1BU05_LEPSM|nr:cleavage stimulation factor subunit 1-like [Lepeophtheirus salmonis]ACO12508.1 Cleavage stimulation factor 50 kDa subunit [Lepeophtheirus salmonis]CAB4054940.1 CSTF1 [Lepeophtheirus salmonis]CAF2765929.1 CSTF1 [Lepeophtheirus salmonis]
MSVFKPKKDSGMDPPEFTIGGNVLKNRDALYRLIISQLFYDGYQQVALQLSGIVGADPPCPPSERLHKVVSLGLEKERNAIAATKVSAASNGLGGDLYGLDLEFDTEMRSEAPEPALYETAYVTSHKAFCRAGAFSNDGQLCATGSADASIKVLDVDRMLAKSNNDIPVSKQSEGHPVIRTLYDHVDEVTCLEFHPKETILASGSKDNTIKLFDYSKASAKKACRTIIDAEPVQSLSFHPSGDFLLVGCEHPVVRLYDVNTSQCFVSSIPHQRHTSEVTMVKFSNDGKIYASSSTDGSIKIWDGVSSKVINTFDEAHDGAEVCSVYFTRNGKYILSSGKDSLIKLWELSTSRCLIAYTGAGATGRQEHRAQAVFNHTEDYVMFPDEATTSLCCWDSRNASRKQLLSLGHNGAVRNIVHSAVSPAFLTSSDDFRARFWFKRCSPGT